ncbi:MAG: osmotically-inducible protein OsmY [Pirellulaceae bacterium]|jgi:osmotically-inducible protein OsmY
MDRQQRNRIQVQRRKRIMSLKLRNDIQDAISNSGHLRGMHGKAVEYSTDGDEVTIDGEVSSFYHAQLAQEIIGKVEGVTRVHNNLRVTTPSF